MPQPPSPYPYLLKRHDVESLRDQASAYAGYKATIANDEHPNYPPWLLWDLPHFAVAVLRLCKSHLALEDILNEISDAAEGDDEEEREKPAEAGF